MMKTYFNLKNYNKYIVRKHSNLRNRGHPPSFLYLKYTYTNFLIIRNGYVPCTKKLSWIPPWL